MDQQISSHSPYSFKKLTTGELVRKLIHISGVFLPLSFYFLPLNLIKWAVGVGFALFLTVDLLRLHCTSVQKIYDSIFGKFTREYEKHRLTGATILAASSFFTIMVFPREIAVIVLFYAILSDGIASIVGQWKGKRRLIGEKTLEGTLSFLVVSIIIAILYKDLPFWLRVLSAIFSTILEVIDLGIDDNISIPIGTGLFLAILKKI